MFYVTPEAPTMDEETLLIIGAAGIGIYVLYKSGVFEGLAKTTSGVGEAVQGIGTGINTIGVETGENYKAISDFYQTAIGTLTSALRNNQTPNSVSLPSPNAPTASVRAGLITVSDNKPVSVFGEYNLGGRAVTGTVLNQIQNMQQMPQNIFNTGGVVTDTSFMNATPTTQHATVIIQNQSQRQTSGIPVLKSTKTPISTSVDLRNTSYQAMAKKMSVKK